MNIPHTHRKLNSWVWGICVFSYMPFIGREGTASEFKLLLPLINGLLKNGQGGSYGVRIA